MDAWEAITSRRNVRWYTDEPIDPDDLDRILEAGRRAPSSRNTQPWDFVVVTDRDQLLDLSQVWQGAGHVGRSAATVGVVADELVTAEERAKLQFDLGQAVMQMMIAAAGMGIGSGHAAVRDQDLARRVLDLPNGKALHWLIGFGYPKERPLSPIEEPIRRDFDDVVHRGKW